MRWTELFADLEARLAAEEAFERRAEVADRTRREWASVLLVERLAGGLGGAPVRLDLAGGVTVEGRIDDVGKDWALVTLSVGGAAVIPLRAVVAVGGLAGSSDGRENISRRRFGFGVVLRELARDRVGVRVAVAGGGVYEGVVARVGADHVDIAPRAVEGADRLRRPRVVTVVFDHISAVFDGR